MSSHAVAATSFKTYLGRSFMGNVSVDVDPQELLEFFGQFGEIENGR